MAHPGFHGLLVYTQYVNRKPHQGITFRISNIKSAYKLVERDVSGVLCSDVGGVLHWKCALGEIDGIAVAFICSELPLQSSARAVWQAHCLCVVGLVHVVPHLVVPAAMLP